jgi:hypothetical protein
MRGDEGQENVWQCFNDFGVTQDGSPQKNGEAVHDHKDGDKSINNQEQRLSDGSHCRMSHGDFWIGKEKQGIARRTKWIGDVRILRVENWRFGNTVISRTWGAWICLLAILLPVL